MGTTPTSSDQQPQPSAPPAQQQQPLYPNASQQHYPDVQQPSQPISPPAQQPVYYATPAAGAAPAAPTQYQPSQQGQPVHSQQLSSHQPNYAPSVPQPPINQGQPGATYQSPNSPNPSIAMSTTANMQPSASPQTAYMAQQPGQPSYQPQTPGMNPMYTPGGSGVNMGGQNVNGAIPQPQPGTPVKPTSGQDETCGKVGYFFLGFLLAIILDAFAFLFFCCAEGAGITAERRAPFFTGIFVGFFLMTAIYIGIIVAVIS